MGLLICPNCLERNTRNILGSVTDEGNFVIQRYHRALTIVMSANFTIACQCGFGTTLTHAGGVINLK